jgi:hypothetical protein
VQIGFGIFGEQQFDFKKASRKLKVENEKVKKAKGKLARLKKEILALKKQAKIAQSALEDSREEHYQRQQKHMLRVRAGTSNTTGSAAASDLSGEKATGPEEDGVKK